MKLIKTLWRGEESLGRAFWLYGLCVNLLVKTIVEFIASDQYFIESLLGKSVFWLLLGFRFIYGPFIFISIWRSANNYPYRYEGITSTLAKIVVVIGWISYLIEIAIMTNISLV